MKNRLQALADYLRGYAHGQDRGRFMGARAEQEWGVYNVSESADFKRGWRTALDDAAIQRRPWNQHPLRVPGEQPCSDCGRVDDACDCDLIG